MVRSLWTLFSVDSLVDAREALRRREGVSETNGQTHISAWSGEERADRAGADIAAWARSKRVSSVVWTALPPRFGNEDGRVPTEEEAVHYLRGLRHARRAAERYVRMAPRQIDTPYRRRFEAEFGWTPLRESCGLYGRIEMVDMKEKVLEIAEIAKACPENLQAVCFELLLRHHLESLSSPKPLRGDDPAAGTRTPEIALKPNLDSTKGQDDLSEVDLHVKVKHFMKKHGVTLDHLNNLYYKEGDAIMPLYEDLKTTRLAESQVRIALLQSLRNAIASGAFEAQVADVRTECTQRKCYDQNNFGNNFNNNAALFDFEKYTKTETVLRLSEDGRKGLAEVIKELQ
jgi:hypothetical protein